MFGHFDKHEQHFYLWVLFLDYLLDFCGDGESYVFFIYADFVAFCFYTEMGAGFIVWESLGSFKLSLTD